MTENPDTITFGPAVYQQDKEHEVVCIARLSDPTVTEFEIATAVTDVNGKELPVVKIGDQAFASLSIKKIVVPACINVIQRGAFFKCSSLETVEFQGDSSLKWIDEGAFLESGLISFVLPKNVKKMGIWAFKKCERLTHFSFADGCALEELPEAVFQFCTALTSFTVPSSVKMIDKFAFEGCTNLKTFDFAPGSQLRQFGGACFRETAIQEFTVPVSCTDLGPMTFDNLKSLEKINIDPATPISTIPAACFHNTKITEIAIPASVTEIREFAFAECEQLVNVSFCEGSLLGKIGYGAFAATAIESFGVGPHFSCELEGRAFWKCANLTTFKCAQGGRVPGVQEEVFKDTKLTHLEVPGCKWFGKDSLAGTTLRYLTVVDEGAHGAYHEMPVRFARCGVEEEEIRRIIQVAANIPLEFC